VIEDCLAGKDSWLRGFRRGGAVALLSIAGVLTKAHDRGLAADSLMEAVHSCGTRDSAAAVLNSTLFCGDAAADQGGGQAGYWAFYGPPERSARRFHGGLMPTSSPALFVVD